MSTGLTYVTIWDRGTAEPQGFGASPTLFADYQEAKNWAYYQFNVAVNYWGVTWAVDFWITVYSTSPSNPSGFYRYVDGTITWVEFD